MATFISRLILLCTLSIPAFSFAITIPGNIHPERYTFFLTDRGGEMLREMNDAAVSVKLNNKVVLALRHRARLLLRTYLLCCTQHHPLNRTLSATTVNRLRL